MSRVSGIAEPILTRNTGVPEGQSSQGSLPRQYYQPASNYTTSTGTVYPPGLGTSSSRRPQSYQQQPPQMTSSTNPKQSTRVSASNPSYVQTKFVSSDKPQYQISPQAATKVNMSQNTRDRMQYTPAMQQIAGDYGRAQNYDGMHRIQSVDQVSANVGTSASLTTESFTMSDIQSLSKVSEFQSCAKEIQSCIAEFKEEISFEFPQEYLMPKPKLSKDQKREEKIVKVRHSSDSKLVAYTDTKSSLSVFKLVEDGDRYVPQEWFRLGLENSDDFLFVPHSHNLLIFSSRSVALYDLSQESKPKLWEHLLSKSAAWVEKISQKLHENSNQLSLSRLEYSIQADVPVYTFFYFNPFLIYKFSSSDFATKPVITVFNLGYTETKTPKLFRPEIANQPQNYKLLNAKDKSFVLVERQTDGTSNFFFGSYFFNQIEQESNQSEGESNIAAVQMAPNSFQTSIRFADIPTSAPEVQDEEFFLDSTEKLNLFYFYDKKSHFLSRVNHSSAVTLAQIVQTKEEIVFSSFNPKNQFLITIDVNFQLVLWKGIESPSSDSAINKFIEMLKTYSDRCLAASITPDNRSLLLFQSLNDGITVTALPLGLAAPLESRLLSSSSSVNPFQFSYLYSDSDGDVFYDSSRIVKLSSTGTIIRQFSLKDDPKYDLELGYNFMTGSSLVTLDTPAGTRLAFTALSPPLDQRMLDKRLAESEKGFLCVACKTHVSSLDFLIETMQEREVDGMLGIVIISVNKADFQKTVLIDTFNLQGLVMGKEILTGRVCQSSRDLLVGAKGSTYYISNLSNMNDFKEIKFPRDFSGEESLVLFQKVNGVYFICFTKGQLQTVIYLANEQFSEFSFDQTFDSFNPLTHISCCSEKSTIFAAWEMFSLAIVNTAQKDPTIEFWKPFDVVSAKNFVQEAFFCGAEFSPDGLKLLVIIHSGNNRLYNCMSIDQSTVFEMTSHAVADDSTVYAFSHDSNYWFTTGDFSKKQVYEVTIFDLSCNRLLGSVSLNKNLIPLRLCVQQDEIEVVSRFKNELEIYPRYGEYWSESIGSALRLFKTKIPIKVGKNSFLPLIQYQMMLYFATDKTTRKNEIAKTINYITGLNHSHLVASSKIYTLIAYMLNSKLGFEEYGQKMNINDMIKNHHLLKLFFQYNKPESSEAILDLIKSYLETNLEYPAFDEQTIFNLMMQNEKTFLKNPAAQIFLRNLLFNEVGINPLVGLKDEFEAMCVLDKASANDSQNSNQFYDSYKNIIDPEASDPKAYRCFETKIGLDLTNGSKLSCAFFSMLEQASDADIQERYKVIINYKWCKIFWYAMIYAVLHWTMTILYYIYLGYLHENPGMLIAIIIFTSLFLLFELKCAVTNIGKYFSDFWNLVDLVSLILGLVAVGLRKDRSSEDRIGINWLRMVSVLLLCFRSIVHLKVFASTRYIISMVLVVGYKLIPFMVVLTSFIFTFAIVWKISPRLSADMIEQYPELSFFVSLSTGTNIIFGSSPTEATGLDGQSVELGTIQYLILLVSNIVLALTMMNFLIAVISAAFEEISTKKEIYDAKELLSIIKDFDSFFGLLPGRNKEPKYFISLIEKEKEDANAQMLEMVSEMNLLLKVSLEGQFGNRDTHNQSPFIDSPQMLYEQGFPITIEQETVPLAAPVSEPKKNRLVSIIKLPFPPTTDEKVKALVDQELENLPNSVPIDMAIRILESDPRFFEGLRNVSELDFNQDETIDLKDFKHLLLCSYKEEDITKSPDEVNQPRTTSYFAGPGVHLSFAQTRQPKDQDELPVFGAEAEVKPSQLIFCVQQDSFSYKEVIFERYNEIQVLKETPVFVEVDNEELITPKQVDLEIEEPLTINKVIERSFEIPEEEITFANAPEGTQLKLIKERREIEYLTEENVQVVREISKLKMIKVRRGDPKPTINYKKIKKEVTSEVTRMTPKYVKVLTEIPYPDQATISEMISRPSRNAVQTTYIVPPTARFTGFN